MSVLYFYCHCCDAELDEPGDVGYCDECSDSDCRCQDWDSSCSVCGGNEC